MTGLQMITEKFRTNVDHKGYDAAHDDAHTKGELVDAVLCYLAYSQRLMPPELWPFEADAWKQSDDPIRNLVRAGALIAAEIDRLERARNRP